jgi:hypothetical protein
MYYRQINKETEEETEGTVAVSESTPLYMFT